jgi:CRP-like cAMP-binding protein
MNAQKYIEGSSELKKYFSEFTSADIEKIDLIEYPAGSIINDQDTDENSVFFLVQGIGAVYRKIENGELFKYYYITKNDVFGLSDVIDPNKIGSYYTIKAMNDIILLKVTQTQLNKFKADYPKFENKIVIGIIERLHQALTVHVECKKYNSTINIVSYLIFTYEIYHTMYDSNYIGYVPINETRATISDFTGISIRSINNTIDLLKKLNYISVIKGKVNINIKEYATLKSYKASNI